MDRTTTEIILKLAEKGYKKEAHQLATAMNSRVASSMPRFFTNQAVNVFRHNSEDSLRGTVREVSSGALLVSSGGDDTKYKWTGSIFEESNEDVFSIPVAILPL